MGTGVAAAVSNKRKLKTDAGPVERCTSCGRRIGKLAESLRLRTGQVICPRCQQYGELPRLSCGHVSLPGSYVVRNVGGMGEERCPVCAPEAAAEAAAEMGTGTAARLGLSPRKEARS